jgi:hypothetical protein
MKVHVIVDEALAATAERRENLLEELERIGFECANRQRFDLFGILTGEVDAANVARIEKVPGVEAVQADHKKYAT